MLMFGINGPSKFQDAHENQVERKSDKGVAYPDVFRVHVWQIYFTNVYIPVGWNTNLKFSKNNFIFKTDYYLFKCVNYE